jgi:hypothetical protein
LKIYSDKFDIIREVLRTNNTMKCPKMKENILDDENSEEQKSFHFELFDY